MSTEEKPTEQHFIGVDFAKPGTQKLVYIGATGHFDDRVVHRVRAELSEAVAKLQVPNTLSWSDRPEILASALFYTNQLEAGQSQPLTLETLREIATQLRDQKSANQDRLFNYFLSMETRFDNELPPDTFQIRMNTATKRHLKRHLSDAIDATYLACASFALFAGAPLAISRFFGIDIAVDDSLSDSQTVVALGRNINADYLQWKARHCIKKLR